MFSFVKVAKNNIIFLKSFDKCRTELNMLNRNFFEVYDKASLPYKFIIKRKVLMIKDTVTDNYCGYIWFTHIRKNICRLNSIFLSSGYNKPDNYKEIINSFRRNNKIRYLCQKENNNFEILENCGFEKKDGTYEMKLILSNKFSYDTKDNIAFETLKVGSQESLRCKIQNEIFFSRARLPISKLDIIYDERQDYYFPEGSVFLKISNEYIGYGQIIIEMDIPVIVNFGIVKKYRNLGYARILLSYLLNLLIKKEYSEVVIRVKADNTHAVNLYSSFGFKIIKEVYKFEIAN